MKNRPAVNVAEQPGQRGVEAEVPVQPGLDLDAVVVPVGGASAHDGAAFEHGDPVARVDEPDGGGQSGQTRADDHGVR